MAGGGYEDQTNLTEEIMQKKIDSLAVISSLFALFHYLSETDTCIHSYFMLFQQYFALFFHTYLVICEWCTSIFHYHDEQNKGAKRMNSINQTTAVSACLLTLQCHFWVLSSDSCEELRKGSVRLTGSDTLFLCCRFNGFVISPCRARSQSLHRSGSTSFISTAN